MLSQSSGGSMLNFRFSFIYISQILLLLPAVAFSTSPPGLVFEHHDWQLVCDNTRTCRAAGYQSDDMIDSPIGLVFTRKAGANEPVSAELYLRSTAVDIESADKFIASLYINNKFLGNISVDRGSAKMTPNQTNDLLSSFKSPSKIEVKFGKFKWTLSDKGSTAVLVKMDEYQGRIGTVGAILKKGPKDESGVLPLLMPPTIIAASTPVQIRADEEFAKTYYNDLYPALQYSLRKDSVCALHDDYDEDEKPELTSIRLSQTRFIIYTQCWAGMYNQGIGFWIVNSSPPFKATLITDSGSDYAEGQIWAHQKRRGLGDCWYSDEWTWDGKKFIHTVQNAASLCKGFLGDFLLPRIVTKLQKIQ
jgi:hypothetical protein